MEGVTSTYFRGVAEGKRSDFYAPSLVCLSLTSEKSSFSTVTGSCASRGWQPQLTVLFQYMLSSPMDRLLRSHVRHTAVSTTRATALIPQPRCPPTPIPRCRVLLQRLPDV